MKNISSILMVSVFLAIAQFADAGSATWNLNPASDDWNTATNWNPATVPNGPADIATFGVSNAPAARVSNSATAVSEIVFDPGASPFTITSTFINNALTISGPGVTNNSGITQNFATVHEIMNQGGGEIVFENSAKAGTDTVYSIGKDAHFNTGSALTEMLFRNTSNADHATLIVISSQLLFSEASTADEATITCTQGIYPGGELWFLEGSTAANASITIEGAVGSDATQGSAFFQEFASGGNATFVVEGGSNGGRAGYLSFGDSSTAANSNITATGGGTIFFSNHSVGRMARITLADGGRLDVSGQDTSVPLKIGSLQGDGLVLLGGRPVSLCIGANNLSTDFDGRISGSGSITKIGRGTVRFTQANTYTGGTTIKGGAFSIDNVTGSGCGSGPVNVEGGTLLGTGTIAGAVTVGTGNGLEAILAPGKSRMPPAALTIQSSLLLNADSTFRLRLNSNSGSAGAAVANRVTINSGALFEATDTGAAQLTPGTVFVVVNNTAATPISGTFANLADGGTVAIGTNTFQANYEGGDGNDLTLTVL